MDKNLEDIYNAYQKAVNSELNRPFKYRKDFSGFESEHPDWYAGLQKLGRIFGSYSGINVDLYFRAPYKLGVESEYIPVHEYAKPRFIKCYKDYAATLKPDGFEIDFSNERVFDGFKSGLRHIVEVCVRENIRFSEYIAGETGRPCRYRWVEDCLSNRINDVVLCSMFFVFGEDLFGELCGKLDTDISFMVMERIGKYAIGHDSLEIAKSSFKKISNFLKNRNNAVDTAE